MDRGGYNNVYLVCCPYAARSPLQIGQQQKPIELFLKWFLITKEGSNLVRGSKVTTGDERKKKNPRRRFIPASADTLMIKRRQNISCT